jgi:drug/metabolite transporter (DMT)-like permease
MKLTDTLLLIALAAIWGSSFMFMRATVEAFGPIALIAVRVGVAALFLGLFLLTPKRRKELGAHWKHLAWIGVINSALPFVLFAYASISLSGGNVSLLNTMTPVFTAIIAHFWLKDKMSPLQILGLFICIIGLVILVWDKLDISEADSPSLALAIFAGISAPLFYGFASNSTKKYLSKVTPLTATAGSLLFATLFMLLLLPFFMPNNINHISNLDWIYAIILGLVCTAVAYLIFFKLIHDIGPSRAVSVTFLIPIFAFIWGYLVLDEVVTLRMWGATAIIVVGMSFVLKLIGANHNKTSA